MVFLTGKPRAFTWTRLAATAEVGSKILVLTDPVDWQIGERIVITSTGGNSSQRENEEHEIASKSANKNDPAILCNVESGEFKILPYCVVQREIRRTHIELPNL